MKKLPLVTARSAVEIRGVYGQSVLDLHGQMRRLLMQTTGDRAVGDVFAEPQLNPVRGEIAWYTDADGPIVAVTELPPDAQQVLWSRLDSLRAQIKTAAERYIASGTQTASTRADTFRAMLTVTDPQRCLFSVGGQPVLAEWGCSLVAGEERSVDLWTISSGGARKGGMEAPGEESTVAVSAEPEATSVITHVAPEAQALNEVVVPQALEDAAIEPDQPDPGKLRESARPRRTDVPPARPVSPALPNVAWQGALDWSHQASDRSNVRVPHQRSSALWRTFKYLLLLALAFLLIGALLHACSATSNGLTQSSDSEERQLRAEIASLRDQAGQIAERCVSTGTKP